MIPTFLACDWRPVDQKRGRKGNWKAKERGRRSKFSQTSSSKGRRPDDNVPSKRGGRIDQERTEAPLIFAISVNLANTCGTVKAFNLNNVGCLPFEFCATRPKSPNLARSAFT